MVVTDRFGYRCGAQKAAINDLLTRQWMTNEEVRQALNQRGYSLPQGTDRSNHLDDLVRKGYAEKTKFGGRNRYRLK